MVEFLVASPFGNEALDEVPLASAPLVRVIAQLRFPQLASMANEAVAHEFARDISGDYPLLEQAHEVNLVIAQGTVSPQEQPTSSIWRLQSADGNWIVTLSRTALSLETLAYTSRRDFCGRLTAVAEAFASKARPPRFDRFGLRYINRVVDPGLLLQLPALVRREMMGPAALDLPQDVTLGHSLSEVQLIHEANALLARCGILPEHTTLDPSVPAVATTSWVLDIDSFIVGSDAIPVDSLGVVADDLARRAYQFFRYTASRELLTLFGGTP